MSESVVTTNAASPVAASAATTLTATEKKVAAKKAVVKSKVVKKASAAPVHPPTQQMVDASIRNLKERGGSSLLAIKKYISSTYKCDAQKLAPFIKKYLKTSVASGKLIQTKGKGASGSFKLSSAVSKAPKSVEKLKLKKVKKATPSSSTVAGKKKPTSMGKKLTAGEKKVKKVKPAATSTAAAKKSSASGLQKKAGEKAKVKAKVVKKPAVSKVSAGKVTKAKTAATKAKPAAAASRSKVASAAVKKSVASVKKSPAKVVKAAAKK